MAFSLDHESSCRSAKLDVAVSEELTRIYRNILEIHVPSKDIFTKVTNCIHFQKNNLHDTQIQKLKMAQSSGYKELDITLMYSLLRNLCPNITPPSKGWGIQELPDSNEITTGDDIERIRIIRNEIRHKHSAGVSESDFTKWWTEICNVCNRQQQVLGGQYVTNLRSIECMMIDDIRLKNLEKYRLESLAEEVLYKKSLKISLESDEGESKVKSLLECCTETLKVMVDHINENTTRDEISVLYETFNHYLDLGKPIEENPVALGILTGMKNKIHWYARLNPNKTMRILAEFGKFTCFLKRDYEVSQTYRNGSIVMTLGFYGEHTLRKFVLDFEKGKIQELLEELLCFRDLLSIFDLNPDRLRILVEEIIETSEEGRDNEMDDQHTAGDYDVFIIHSNEQEEDRNFALNTLKKMLELRGLKVMTDADFLLGNVVLNSISEAVRCCSKSLIILTEKSHESPWCTLELILALEKSHRQNMESVVVLRKSNNKEVEFQLALEMLNTVPRVDIKDYTEIIEDEGKMNELVRKLKEKKRTEELLPAGNIAHAQVWSHYTGLLQYLLPEIENLIKKTDIYKNHPTRFSLKLYELVPESCICPQIIKDIPESEIGKRITAMDEKLPEFRYKRAGNWRTVRMTIYCVTDADGTEYYCLAECPAVLAGIHKMVEESSTKLRDCDRQMHVGRFYYTLTGLLHHKNLGKTYDKAHVIMYNENRPGFILADEMVKAIKHDLHIAMEKREKEEVPLEVLECVESTKYEKEAFIFYHSEDHDASNEIAKYLQEKGIKFYREDERIGQRVLDLESATKTCCWTIVVLTKKSLSDPIFSFSCLMMMGDFLEEKKLRMIPVLVDIKYEEVPDALRFVTYVAVDESKRYMYLERLRHTLTSEAIPFEKESLIPAGDVTYVLAWTYVLNYLQYVLKDPEQEGKDGLETSIEKALIKHNKNPSSCRKKVYIIVPYSCEIPDCLTEKESSISLLDTIHPVYVNLAGTIKREYTFDMYQFENSGREFIFVGQYAAPAACLRDMHLSKIAGIDEEKMVQQAGNFCKEMNEILKQKFVETIARRCEVVFYDDKASTLEEEMLRRIESP